MKRLFLLMAMLVFPAFALAQNTAVTATVLDPTGRAYNFATGYAALVCPGNQAPSFNGFTVPRTFAITGLDGNGTFTQVVYDVNSIQPANCGYQWHITWQDGITSFITGTITAVTGVSVNLSTAISSYSVILPGAGGSVIGVLATPPIVSSGGLTPNLSCPTCLVSTSQIPISLVGSAGLSGTSPISIASTGAISCPTCSTGASAFTLNQLVIGAGSQGQSSLGTLGTTTTLLHGNAAGAPTFSAVNLAADVTGQLPITRVGSAGLSGVGPVSVASTGAISLTTAGTSVLKNGSNGGNYVGATGSFAAVDGTNLSYTVTIPVGSNLIVNANGTMSPTGGTTTWYVALFDGASKLTEQPLTWTAGGASNSCPGTMNCGATSFSLNYLIAGDGASHTIQLEYMAEGASNDTSGRIINSGGMFPTMTFILQ